MYAQVKQSGIGEETMKLSCAYIIVISDAHIFKLDGLTTIMTKFLCFECNAFINVPDDRKISTCPFCNSNNILETCAHDRICACAQEVQYGIKYCPTCGKPICACGSHDVIGISRVTGYLQDVSGWNVGKRQELIDRQRYLLN
jgi:anaerobic ribonucleoside-triphosphate reductase